MKRYGIRLARVYGSVGRDNHYLETFPETESVLAYGLAKANGLPAARRCMAQNLRKTKDRVGSNGRVHTLKGGRNWLLWWTGGDYEGKVFLYSLEPR